MSRKVCPQVFGRVGKAVICFTRMPGIWLHCRIARTCQSAPSCFLLHVCHEHCSNVGLSQGSIKPGGIGSVVSSAWPVYDIVE